MKMHSDIELEKQNILEFQKVRIDVSLFIRNICLSAISFGLSLVKGGTTFALTSQYM